MSDPEDFDSHLSPEFRWPKSGDRPFNQSPDWQENAHISKNIHSRLVMMMTGYKKGADLMVERTLDNPSLRDVLVCPIVFNYRQFIELSLKYLIATYGHTVGINAIWNAHDLNILWKDFAKILDGYECSDPDETDPIVAEVVATFAQVDPSSFSHRYPVDKKGDPIPLAHELLDLATLADVMTALENYFSGCDGYLDSLQNAIP